MRNEKEIGTRPQSLGMGRKRAARLARILTLRAKMFLVREKSFAWTESNAVMCEGKLYKKICWWRRSLQVFGIECLSSVAREPSATFSFRHFLETRTVRCSLVGVPRPVPAVALVLVAVQPAGGPCRGVCSERRFLCQCLLPSPRPPSSPLSC